MKIKIITFLALAMLIAIASESNTYAQGRGRGGGGGRPATAGSGNGGGINHGLGTAGSNSNGRSDNGLGNSSTRSNGRADTGRDRARMASAKAGKMSDTELNRYRGLSRRLGTTPEEMRARYQAALLANPDLTFGNFVAAHVIADNVNGRFPGVTAPAILAGLANGDNLGQTLRDLRMTKEQAKIVQRDAEDRIDAAKRRNQ